jgi:hypothetical protein
LARSDGWKVLTNGIAHAAAPTAPTAPVTAMALRREGSREDGGVKPGAVEEWSAMKTSEEGRRGP